MEEEGGGGCSREVRILLTSKEHIFPNKMEEEDDHEKSTILLDFEMLGLELPSNSDKRFCHE